MIELVSQIDSKITACCFIIQPIGNRLVPSMLAAGANREIALVKIYCQNELCNPNCSFFPPAFYISSSLFDASKRLALNNYVYFN